MYDAIHWLSEHHAMWVLLALGTVLILLDYLFRTDVPAHFGYACFAGALFFALPLAPSVSIAVMVGAFVVLELLHRFVFTHFLTNAPGKERRTEG